MNVKLIRMWSGEDVIADLVKDTNESVIITNPIVAVPSQQEGQIAFAPWSPLLSGRDVEVEVTRKYIVYIAESQDDIVEQYNSMFTPVATPPRKKLIL